jgi:hypothetical protein
MLLLLLLIDKWMLPLLSAYFKFVENREQLI